MTMTSDDGKLQSLLEIIAKLPIVTTADALAAEKEKGKKVFATHSDTFHCDEVCATVILAAVFKDAVLIRTRDQKILETADVVYDVGGVYEPSKHRYDHHQRGFCEMFDENHVVTKMSSLGMVFKHLGPKFVGEFIGIDPKYVNDCIEWVYTDFVEYVDATDNGVSSSSDGIIKYTLNTQLANRIGRCNKRWFEPEESKEEENERFRKAMALAATEMMYYFSDCEMSKIPCREVVKEAIEKRFEVHPSGRVLKFENGGCPFQNELYLYETEHKIEEILYALLPDKNQGWRVRCVSIPNSFTNRLSLPECLRGVPEDKLEETAGFPGLTFIHNAGFIGGAKNLEAALQLVDMALSKKRERE